MSKKNGFTLIELIAIIILIALIALIAVPFFTKIISDVRLNSFKINASSLERAARNKYIAEGNSGEILYSNEQNPLDITDKTLKYKVLVNGIDITILEMENSLFSILNNPGEACSNGCSAKEIIENPSTTIGSLASILSAKKYPGYIESKSVNGPQLVQGMTAIKWENNEWIDISDPYNDTTWYDYESKIWANAKTMDGSMWVWIPRYIYKINVNWNNTPTGTIDVQFSKGLNDNWNNALIGEINTLPSSTSSNNAWTNHPAFKFGDENLYGIWVAKFEATSKLGVNNPFSSNGSCATADDNISNNEIQILPNVESLRCISISNAFISIRNMETNSIYGWDIASDLNGDGSFSNDDNNIDTHLIKNTEWGAVAYLSKSIYGKNDEEVYINNSQQFITGCVGNAVASGAFDGCQNQYDSLNGFKGSTTGNIYGIYDMSGGAWEYQAAYVNNSNSGQGIAVKNALDKYKDVYPITTDGQVLNFESAINVKGDALYETSKSPTGSNSWYGDYSSMPSGGNLYFIRGGRFANGNSCGTFAYSPSWGGANSTNGFRVVLVSN